MASSSFPFHFTPCIWKRHHGQESFLGTGHCCMMRKFWKKKLHVKVCSRLLHQAWTTKSSSTASIFPDPFVTVFSHLGEPGLPNSRAEFSRGRGMTLEPWFWIQGNIFVCNLGKKENSLKTAWIEAPVVVCFCLLPLFWKSGDSFIVPDFTRKKCQTPFKKHHPQFSVYDFIKPEDFGLGNHCGTF